MCQTFTKDSDNNIVTGYGRQHLLQNQLPAILTILNNIILVIFTT
jgi:hypothetical protein